MAELAELAIAKATLAAVLLRPDPVPCPRADSDAFQGMLSAAITRCSPANVQKCKHWILQHIVPSAARTAAFGKFLVALSKSFEDKAPGKESDTRPPSARRRRLHVLYIVHDVLYHTAVRDHNRAFGEAMAPTLLLLVKSAASFARAPKQQAKIRALLDLWSTHRCLDDDAVAQLRAAVEEASLAAADQQNQKLKSKPGQGQEQTKQTDQRSAQAGDLPYLMPATHGDPATPWYDLPAATWLAALQPNSTRPMNPAAIKPLVFQPGPADPVLAASVRRLLADVDRMFQNDGSRQKERDGMVSSTLEDDAAEWDVDAMGERVEVDVFTGDILDGDTYYGWSRAFCQKMKTRRRRGRDGASTPTPVPQKETTSGAFKTADDNRADSHTRQRRKTFRSRSRSRSQSRSQSRSARRSRSPERGRDRRRSRSYSGSRSRSRGSHTRSGSNRPPTSRPAAKRRRVGSPRSGSRGRSRSGSSGGSRSRTRRGSRSGSFSRSRDRGRDRAYHRSRSRRGDSLLRVPGRDWPRSRSRDRGRGRNGSSSGSPYSPSPPRDRGDRHHRSHHHHHAEGRRPRDDEDDDRAPRAAHWDRSRSRSPRHADARPPRDGRHGGSTHHPLLPQPPVPGQPLPPLPPPPFYQPGQPAPPPIPPPIGGYPYASFPPPLPPPPPNYRGPWPPQPPFPLPPHTAPPSWGSVPPPPPPPVPGAAGNGPPWDGGWGQQPPPPQGGGRGRGRGW